MKHRFCTPRQFKRLAAIAAREATSSANAAPKLSRVAALRAEIGGLRGQRLMGDWTEADAARLEDRTAELRRLLNEPTP